MKTALGSVAVVLLTACAQSSGVLQMGPDTYMVSVHAAPARGGIPGAQQLAITEATQKCVAEGKQVVVTNTSARPSAHLPGGTAEVIFQCLASGDRDLTRPTYRRPPAAVIERQ